MGLVSSPPGIITEGYVNYKGINLIQTNDQKLRSLRGGKISYIFQDPLSSLHPLYTVQQQLEEAILAHQNLSKEEVYQKCIELLKSVRIPNPSNVLKITHINFLVACASALVSLWLLQMTQK